MSEKSAEKAESKGSEGSKPKGAHSKKPSPNLWYKPILWIFLGFIAYLLIINIYNTSDMDADEARHASQGIIIAEYFGSSGAESYRDFVDTQVTANYPQAGYPALYDPPGHALYLSIAYKIFGKGLVVSRVASQVLIGLLLVFMYLLGSQLFKERKYVYSSIALFLLFPFTFMISRRVMLAIPVALFTVGWYYFTFHPPKKLFDKGIVGINKVWVQVIGGGLCFLGAGFMMYQTLIYIPVFMVVFTLIELYNKKAKLFSEFFRSTVFVMLCQSVIVLIPILWWFSVSFSGSSTIFDLLVHAGTQEVKGTAGIGYYFSFITQLISGTLLVGLLALASFRNQKFVKKHWPMFVFVLVTLLCATFILTNKQLRYMAHAIPFIAFLVIVGLREIVALSEENKPKEQQKTYWGILGLVLIIFLGFGLYSAYGYSVDHGIYSPVYQYLAAEPSPRTFVMLDLATDFGEFAYTHTPDTFLYNSLAIDAPGQSLVYVTANRVRELALTLDQIDDANMYVFVFDPEVSTSRGQEFEEFFFANKFTKKHFYPYSIYHHSVKNPKPVKFSSITDKDKADALVDEADKHFANKEYRKALVLLHEAIELRPLHVRLRIGVATTYLAEAEQLIRQKKFSEALLFVDKAQKIYPWILEEIVGTPLHDAVVALLDAKEKAQQINSTVIQ